MANKVYEVLTSLTLNTGDSKRELSGIRKLALDVGKAVAAAFAVREIVRFTKSAVNAAAAYEDLNITFTAFLGDAEKAKDLLKELDKFSIETPFTPDEVNSAAMALLAFNIEADKIVPTLEDLGNIAAGTGTQFSELTTIYGQVAAVGKLTGERLLQLQERGVPVLTLLSQELGKSEAAVQSLVSSSKISFEIFSEAIASASEEGGKFADLLIQRSTSLNGLISTFQGSVQVFLRQIGERLLPAAKELFSGLNAIFADINEFLSTDVGRDFAEQLAARVAAAFVFIRENADDFFATVQLGFNKLLIVFTKVDNFFNGRKIQSGLEELRANISELEARVAAADLGFSRFFDRLSTQNETDIRRLDLLVFNLEKFGGTLEDITRLQDEFGFNAIDAIAESTGRTREEAEALVEQLVASGEAFGEGVLRSADRPFSELVEIELQRIRNQKTFTPVGREIREQIVSGLTGEEILKNVKEQLEREFSGPELQGISDTLAAVLGEDTIPTEKLAVYVGILDSVNARIKELERIAGETRQGVVDKLIFGEGTKQGVISDREDEIRAAVNRLQNVVDEALQDEPTLIDKIFGDFETQDYINLFSSLADQTFSSLTTRVNANISAQNALISQQQERLRDVRSEILAGNAEVVQSEEEKLNDLIAQRQQYTDDVRALAALEYAAQSAVAVVSAAAQGGGFFSAAAIGTLLASIVGGIAQLQSLAVFHAGTEYVKGQGDEVPSLLRKGERIFTVDQNKRIGPISNEEAAKIVEMYRGGVLSFNTHSNQGQRMLEWQGKIYKELSYISAALQALDIQTGWDKKGIYASLTTIERRGNKMNRLMRG